MALTPDIRVKLTPEGVSEVITALRKVNAESKTALKGTEDIMSRIRGLLPAIGLLAVATGIAAIGKNALRAADEVDDLRQRVGGTTEALSSLQLAAGIQRIEAQAFTKVLITQAGAVGKLKEGAEEQVKAFADLGIELKDIDKLDTPQTFGLIAQRVSQMGDGIDKTNAVVAIFGSKLAGKLIPLLNDVGERGLPAVIAAAQKLGLVVSTELADAAGSINDQFFLMQKKSEGLATQFLIGFAPAILEAFTQIEKDAKEKGADAFVEFGVKAGIALRFVIDALNLVKNVAANTFDIIGSAIGGNVAALAALLRGDLTGAAHIAGNAFLDIGKKAGAGAAQAVQDFDRLAENLTKNPPKLVVKPTVNPKDFDAFGEALGTGTAKAREVLANLNKRISADQLKSLQDLAKQRDKFLAEDIDARKRAAEAAAIGAVDQIAAAQRITQVELDGIRQRAGAALDEFRVAQLLTSQKEQSLRAAAQRQLGESAANTRVQAEITKQTNAELTKNAQAYYDSLTRLNAAYVAQYKTSASAIVAIDKEINANRKEGDDLIRDLRIAQLTEQQQFGVRIRIANEKLEQLQSAVLAGNLDKARELRKEVVSLAGDIAKATNVNPGAINIGSRLITEANDSLEELLQKQRAVEVNNSKIASEGANKTLDQIKTLEETITGLAEKASAIKIGIDDKSLQETVDKIRKVLTETPFEISVTPKLTQGSGSGVQGFAGGGLLGGYSPSPTADNLLIAGTAGEYMQPVRAVQYYGPSFMDDIRNLRIPRFAEGGLVGGSGKEGDSMGSLDISVAGRPIGPVSGERDTLNNLVRAIRTVQRGTA